MKRIIIFFLTVIIALPLLSQVRGKIDIPDLKGYVTLKCDFHVHTVFSHDGSVWPDVRIDEAYHEGLDAIAFTDHIEGWRFKDSLFSSRNRPYEIAQTAARDKGIILIKGGEIAYPAPVGEHNVIFSTNADELYKRNYMDAFSAAKAQNAFIFWNHPSLYYLQPDSTQWFPVHTQLLEQGMMHGIEVVNGPYSPEAHRWCLEKKLTMLGNSDAHQPYNLTFAYRKPKQ